jgi:hypothetical protein
MNREIIYTVLLTLSLLLSACGSNEKEDGTMSNGQPATGGIKTSLQSLVIDKSSGDVSANINLTSTYDSTVIANLSDMNLVLGGCIFNLGSVTSNPSSVTLDKTTSMKNVEFTGTMTDPSCIPTNFHIIGSNALNQNGKTVEAQFKTNTVNIDANSIVFKDISLLKIEVLDKQLDINESGDQKTIRIRVTQGSIGIKSKKVNISSLVTQGSFSSQDAISDDAGDTTFTYTAPNSMLDSSFTIKFCLEEDSTVCDTANINLTTSAIVPPADVVDDINYFITYVPNGGVYNLSLNSRNNAVVTLIDKDTNKAIPNSRIKSITVTSRDASVLKLTSEGGGTPVSNILFGAEKNAVKVLMTADSINSGLASVEVVIEYTNKNGQLQTRGQLFSIAVLSGEPTAFSINSDGVEYNFETKQFEHKFIIQATDASSNPISSSGIINVSAMASFAKDANGREILYGRFSDQRLPLSGKITANLTPEGDSARLDLIGGLSPFNTTNIKEHRAFVAIFGGVDTYEANGKWNIQKGSMSGTTLKLSNAYAGEAYTDLGMAIGYNFRDKFCTSSYEEAVVVIDSTDGTYRLDENGQAVVTLKHDAYMIGKRVMILVNMTGLNPQTGEVLRSGEVHEITLSHNLPLKGDSFPIAKNAINQRITLFGTIDTGTPDEYSVINSTFSCAVKIDNGITGIGLVSQNNPDSCQYDGAAFITYEVNASGDGGTVTFERCQVQNEPKF